MLHDGNPRVGEKSKQNIQSKAYPRSYQNDIKGADQMRPMLEENRDQKGPIQQEGADTLTSPANANTRKPKKPHKSIF